MYNFSFAYLKEIFVITLLTIIENRFENEVRGDEDDESEYIDNYKL